MSVVPSVTHSPQNRNRRGKRCFSYCPGNHELAAGSDKAHVPQANQPASSVPCKTQTHREQTIVGGCRDLIPDALSIGRVNHAPPLVVAVATSPILYFFVSAPSVLSNVNGHWHVRDCTSRYFSCQSVLCRPIKVRYSPSRSFPSFINIPQTLTLLCHIPDLIHIAFFILARERIFHDSAYPPNRALLYTSQTCLQLRSSVTRMPTLPLSWVSLPTRASEAWSIIARSSSPRFRSREYSYQSVDHVQLHGVD